ncbi:MAG: hypothetical protein NVS4B12_15350 [Ktedonobacteraceae bacterium]
MPLKIFCCYAHEDEVLLKKLKKHLKPLQRQRLIDLWYDRDICAGAEWEPEIREHLNSAQIVLLLISPDFIASDYCYSVEMKRALERHERGEVCVIPIILHRVHWQGGPLSKLQVLPTDAKPVSTWRNRNEALFDVAQGIHTIVGKLIAMQPERNKSKTSLQVVADLPCPKCGESVPRDANYCSNCLLLLSPPASEVHLRTFSPLPAAAQAPPVLHIGRLADQPTLVDDLAPHGQVNMEKTESNTVSREAHYHVGLMVAAKSDPGIKRKYKPNEDSLFAAQGVRVINSKPLRLGLFVVADGMGGFANGQDASCRAIQILVDFILPRLMKGSELHDEDLSRLLTEGIQCANQALCQKNMELHANMGTTVTAALIVNATAHVSNVGDSRTYLYREAGDFRKITNDHSVVASLVDAGIIKPDDIYTHPKRNQIYRSLGEKLMVDVDTFIVHLQPGDKLLLCSDGLWDMVRDPQIEEVIRNSSPDPWTTTDGLIKAAFDYGGEDNVSVIVVSVNEMAQQDMKPDFQLITKPDGVRVPQF